jgi:glutamine synthetase
VNGSGKHVNWSIGDNTGANYLEPSASPLRNITLLMTVVSMMIGVKKYANFLNALVLDAGNEKRLGGTEAPPNIMSVYLGEYLSSLLEEIEKLSKVTEKKMAEISLGIRQLPSVEKDSSDRNRTAPMAFTGNKFEFRSVGSSQNCSEVVTLLNLIITEGYERIYEKIVKMNGEPKANALLVVKEMIKETKEIHFEGNCYSVEWKDEAKKRGLINFQNTPEALEGMISKDVLDLYKTFEVLSEKELLARQNIRFKQYVRTKQIELQSACEMAKTEVMPAILKQLALLISASTGKTGLISEQIKELEELFKNINDSVEQINKKITCHCMNELQEQARAYCQCGEDLEKLREFVDVAEDIISREYWPFATYQQLFRRL